MSITCTNFSEFFNENRYRLFLTTAVASGFSLFIVGILFLRQGQLIPSGELYNCTSSDFSVISQCRDPDEFYTQLQSCTFLMRCAANITLMVCQRQCTHFFVSENTGNDVVVRTCSANRDIGFGTMATIWGGLVVFSFLAYLACCAQDFFEGVRDCYASLRQAFFVSAEMRPRQGSPYSLSFPVVPIFEDDERNASFAVV